VGSHRLDVDLIASHETFAALVNERNGSFFSNEEDSGGSTNQ
jgi:hypothetical protein